MAASDLRDRLAVQFSAVAQPNLIQSTRHRDCGDVPFRHPAAVRRDLSGKPVSWLDLQERTQLADYS
jgi:hypothetical protein